MSKDNEINEMDPESDSPMLTGPATGEALCKAMVEAMRAHLRSGKHPSMEFAAELRQMVLAGSLREAIETGQCRFPAGLGVFKLRRMPPNLKRRLPNGEIITTTRERLRVTYAMGVALKRILGYGGYYGYASKRKDPMEGVKPKTE